MPLSNKSTKEDISKTCRGSRSPRSASRWHEKIRRRNRNNSLLTISIIIRCNQTRSQTDVNRNNNGQLSFPRTTLMWLGTKGIFNEARFWHAHAKQLLPCSPAICRKAGKPPHFHSRLKSEGVNLVVFPAVNHPYPLTLRVSSLLITTSSKIPLLVRSNDPELLLYTPPTILHS